MVEITDYGDARRSPEGKIIEVLGHKDDPRVDILSNCQSIHGIPNPRFEELMSNMQLIDSI
mgnify:CR=1 FL=1